MSARQRIRVWSHVRMTTLRAYRDLAYVRAEVEQLAEQLAGAK